MATQAELEELTVSLTGDSSVFRTMMEAGIEKTKALEEQVAALSKGLQEQTEQLKKTDGMWKTIGTTFLSYVAAVGATGWLKEAVGAHIKLEDEQIKMKAAIESNKRAFGPAMEQYEKFTKTIVEHTTATKMEVLGLLRRAEMQGFTGEKAQKLAQDSIGLAEATDMAASHAMTLTIALERGNVQMLRRVPQLRGIKDETELVSKAHQLMSTGLKIAEEKSQSLGGQMDKLNNEYAKIKKQFGSVVAEGLQPVIEATRVAVGWFLNLSAATKQAVVTVVLFSAAAVAGIGAVAAASIALYKLWTAMSGGTLLIVLAVGTLVTAFATAAASLAGFVVAFGGIGAVMAGIKKKALEAWEWLLPVRKAIESLWDTIYNRLVEAWIAVKVAATIAWQYIKMAANLALASMGVSADGLRDTLVMAFLTAEFAIRNFERIATLAWLGVKIGLMSFGGEVDHFFMEALPRYANFMRRVFQDMIENLSGQFKNLGDNVVVIFDRLPDLISGRVKLAQLWKPITQGLQKVDIKPPEIPERVLKDNEIKWRKEYAELGDKLGLDLNTFLANKMAEFAKKNDAKKEGDKLGTDFSSGVKGGLEKLDAPLRRSAEALARISAQHEKLKTEAKPVGAGGAGAADHKVALAKSEELLGQINDKLGKPGADPMMPANVGVA